MRWLLSLTTVGIWVFNTRDPKVVGGRRRKAEFKII